MRDNRPDPPSHPQRISNENTAYSLGQLTTNVNNISDNIDEIRSDIKDIKGNFVSMDRFKPVERVVYGLVALILTAVIGGWLFLILKH